MAERGGSTFSMAGLTVGSTGELSDLESSPEVRTFSSAPMTAMTIERLCYSWAGLWLVGRRAKRSDATGSADGYLIEGLAPRLLDGRRAKWKGVQGKN